jgi:hypothetical protein
MSKPRGVVVVRVSEKGDREDEHFHSPEVQIEAARRWAKDRGERLVASPIPEIESAAGCRCPSVPVCWRRSR